MPLLILKIIGGLLLLSFGAESLVRGSAAVALRLGITPLVVGLTIVAFGTSSPEMVVSIEAALSGNSAMALGNVIGSNISNIGLILAIAALVRPLQVQAQIIRREIPLMILVSLLLGLLLTGGQLNRLEGLLLLIGSFAYTAFAYISARRNKSKIVESEFEDALPKVNRRAWVDILLVLVGLSLLIIGARFLVDGAVAVAERFGVSQVIIGLTIVAVGTSLPELATSVAAARRGEGDIVIGNVIGSNVLNTLFILGIAALINPVQTQGLKLVDVIVMVGSSAVVLPIMRRGSQLARWEGVLLLAGYIGYLSYLLS
jgi:cation:H+ antiporter